MSYWSLSRYWLCSVLLLLRTRFNNLTAFIISIIWNPGRETFLRSIEKRNYNNQISMEFFKKKKKIRIIIKTINLSFAKHKSCISLAEIYRLKDLS